MAEKGVGIPEILNFLVSQDIPHEDALEYINDLIDSQILVSELEPCVTGDDFLERILSVSATLPISYPILNQLKEVKTLLNQIDKNEEQSIVLYETIKKAIHDIGIPFEEKFIFQSDMTQVAENATLGKDIMDEIKSSMVFLNRITQEIKNDDWQKFLQAFSERYEDSQVSLMEALDLEMGIGYPVGRDSNVQSPLIDDVALPYQTNSSATVLVDSFQLLLHEKVMQAISHHKEEIVLTDDDIKDLKENWKQLPPTISSLFTIIKSGTDGTLIKLNHFSGSTGANLLARFSHTQSEIKQLVEDISLKEQQLNPEVVFAEIAHLPDSRTGNILFRPHIRDYEILYLANSDLPENCIIRMSDLTLSMKYGKLSMRSKKLNKEIVPRLTNAHNFKGNAMPVYHFLCDMQTMNDRVGMFFSWGSLEKLLLFRPRVRYKNTILSLASWTIPVSEIKPLFSIQETNLVEEVRTWRSKKGIPQWALLEDGENELFVNWEVPLSIQALFSIIKNRPSIQLSECIYDKEEAVVKDRNGNQFLNECIMCFHQNQEK